MPKPSPKRTVKGPQIDYPAERIALGRSIRAAMGTMPAAELARKAGLKRQLLYPVFNGENFPRVDTILAIARVLGVTPGALIDGKATGPVSPDRVAQADPLEPRIEAIEGEVQRMAAQSDRLALEVDRDKSEIRYLGEVVERHETQFAQVADVLPDVAFRQRATRRR